MKAVIIVGKEGGRHGPSSMSNVVCIDNSTLSDAKDGDEVTFTGKGKLMEHEDGTRYVMVNEVDGNATEEMPDVEYDEGDNGKSEEPEYEKDSNDALDEFMSKKEEK